MDPPRSYRRCRPSSTTVTWRPRSARVEMSVALRSCASSTRTASQGGSKSNSPLEASWLTREWTSSRSLSYRSRPAGLSRR
ncbi:hypothetical protein [Ornithinimicrobium kibberense]|uniref:hypothetical protein n=1 Tax=Ornithinimicrobium kibberense TaxID=282060 RepID=UPI00360A11F1